MPKRLKTQRRGAGSPIYSASKKGTADTCYVDYTLMKGAIIKGEVVELLNDSARTGVLARIVFDHGSEEYTIAPEGMYVGQRVEYGEGAGLEIGNVKPLKDCVEGCPIFNIEKTPGDGGRLLRSSGAFGLILTKDAKKVFVKMPSGKIMEIHPDSRATIGNAGSGGRPDKPFVKAGAVYHLRRARHKKYPIVRGIAMNALSHPFGGANHHPGKSKSTSRRAAPGRKVGDIASSRTGRRKKN